MGGQRTYTSLPSIETANLEQYWDVIRQLDPELFLIKLALQETGVNPLVLPRIVRSIFNLAVGTGHGKVIVYVVKGVITDVEGTEKDKIEEKALIDKER